MTVAGALRELETAPWPLLMAVMQYRAYAREKRARERAKVERVTLPRSRLGDLIGEVEQRLAKEAAEAGRRRKLGR